MTSRVEELQRMCDNINEHGGLDSGEWHTAMLAQIAQNLAVIADVMMADRKTENRSEKPNNCEAQTEPLPKTINGVKIADAVAWADKWLEDNPISEIWDMIRTLRDATEWQTEPQTCEECEHWSDTDDGCADRHGCKTEPQTDCTNCDQVGRCDRGRAVECPQTGRSE